MILIGLFLFAFAMSYHTCDRLTCISVSGKHTWKEIDAYEHTAKTYRALFQANTYRVRVEKNSGLTTDDAALLMKVNMMKISGLFDDARSPYPGALSDRIVCDHAYKPDIRHMTNDSQLPITYYTGWLNDRLQFGSCLDSELPYKSYNAYAYCPREKALYHLEWIINRSKDNEDEYMNSMRTMRCQTPFPSL